MFNLIPKLFMVAGNLFENGFSYLQSTMIVGIYNNNSCIHSSSSTGKVGGDITGWGSKTLKWTGATVVLQCNISNMKYYYIVIG